MSITFTGAGGLFTKIGHIGGILNDLNIALGGAITATDYSVTIPSKVNTLESDYNAGTLQQTIADGIYQQLTAWQGANQGFLSALQALAQSTLIDMVNTDTLQDNNTLQTAMQTVYNQLNGNDHVTASTVGVGSQTAVGTPNSDGTVVISVTDGKGLGLDYIYAETFTITCTSDSQSGGSTKNNEPLSVAGQTASPNSLNWKWPQGSGVSISINCVDAASNNTAGNVLQNSDMETFTTSNNPDNWTIATGMAGTTVFSSTSSFTGTNALQFTGDVGGTLIGVTQTFNTTPTTTVGAGGTSYQVIPQIPYAVNMWIKCSATPAAGVLEVALIDGTGAIINDSNGVANSFTKNLTGVSTTYVNINGVFRLPALLPDTVKLRIRLSTAIDSTKSVYIDHVSMNPMTQIYTGGPFISFFSGSKILLVNDQWTNAVTNTFGGFQRLFQRLFDMRSLGIRLPTTGGTLINDNLIT